MLVCMLNYQPGRLQPVVEPFAFSLKTQADSRSDSSTTMAGHGNLVDLCVSQPAHDDILINTATLCTPQSLTSIRPMQSEQSDCRQQPRTQAAATPVGQCLQVLMLVKESEL
jgi:hypothetical protein